MQIPNNACHLPWKQHDCLLLWVSTLKHLGCSRRRLRSRHSRVQLAFIVESELSSRAPRMTDRASKPLNPRTGESKCSSVCDGSCPDWLSHGGTQQPQMTMFDGPRTLLGHLTTARRSMRRFCEALIPTARAVRLRSHSMTPPTVACAVVSAIAPFRIMELRFKARTGPPQLRSSWRWHVPEWLRRAYKDP
jgi:hypothetical protein